MPIETHADVRGYFRERLVAAMERQRIVTTESTECYLVNLLAKLAIAANEEPLGRPFAELLAEALEAQGHEKLSRLREVGDSALYVCGFFADHLEHRGIARSYVVAMGGRAYLTARAIAPLARAGELSPIFEELAARFELYAQVLDDVRESTAMRTPQDIIRLYERWRRTGSSLLAERLEQEGVYPVSPKDPTLH